MKLARPWLVAYLGAVAALFAVSALHPGGLRRASALSADVRRVRDENERLHERNLRLRREARALAGDAGALERAAREDLGYVRPGERVYELRPTGGSP